MCCIAVLNCVHGSVGTTLYVVATSSADGFTCPVTKKLWMPEAGEWVRAFNGEDVTIFHRRLSCLAYRLADRQLRNRTGSERLLLLFFTLLISHVQIFCPMAAASGVNMLSQHGEVALAGPGGAGMPAVSLTNTSVSSTPTPDPNNRGCENGALMDSFGIFLQGLLAVMAFSTLMCKYG